MLLRACTTSVSWFTGFVILMEIDRAMNPVTQEIATNTSAIIALATATTRGTSDSSLEKALRNRQESGGFHRGREASLNKCNVCVRLAFMMHVPPCLAEAWLRFGC